MDEILSEKHVPAGGYAWVNNLGEYFVTESPIANQNKGPNLHGERLQPVR